MTYDSHKIRDFGIGIYTSIQNAVRSLLGQGFHEKHVGPGGERKLVHQNVPGFSLELRENTKLGLCYATVSHLTNIESRNLLDNLVIG